MFDTQSIKRDFGDAASRYDEAAELQRRVRTRLLALAEYYFPTRANVLDTGCGTGAFFTEAKKTWHVAGIDISLNMCKKSLNNNILSVCADAESLPFADQHFDAVFSSLMLQWVNDMPKTLSEIARVLTPGGYAAIATLAEGTLAELKTAFATVDHAPHVSDFSPPHRLLAAASDAGFALVAAKQDAIIEYFPDTIALMRSLQAIGATNKSSQRRRGLMTPRQFARLEQTYPYTPKGYPATWQVLYLLLRKY